jgi:hypothetical protein
MASLIAGVAALLSSNRPTPVTCEIEDRLSIVDVNGRRVTLMRTWKFEVVG